MSHEFEMEPVEFDELTDHDIVDIDLENDYDSILEPQELEDFCQDGYFENVEPCDDGFWG